MQTSPSTGLRRRLTLTLLVFYGIGTILGAGIYVLIGQVAGSAGMLTPLAFLLASLLAGFSAFSYTELSTRYPKSAGEAVYIKAGFNSNILATIVGFMIVGAGVASTATLLNGLLGYLGEFFTFQKHIALIIIVIMLTAIVIWGIAQSVIIASIMTVLEIIGLLIILWVTQDSWGALPDRLPEFFALGKISSITAVLLGAFIAFYAFIGFEDMVNVAEEVKDPLKNLPRGIIIALVITTILYILIATASVLTVDPAMLAKSDAPLAFLYQIKTGQDSSFISFISIASILNGALVQIIMASRILYGMSNQNWLPKYFSKVNSTTATPINAIVSVAGIILILAIFLPLLSLAKLTSFITLGIFTIINLALWRIKRRDPVSPSISVPMWVPVTGFIFSLLFLVYQTFEFLK